MERDQALDAVFAALADPTRRRLVGLLLTGDRPVGDLATSFEMSLTAVSKHLGVLMRAGLVSQRREGRVRWCRLHPEGLGAAQLWLESLGQLAPLDLDALEARLLEEGLIPDERGASDPGADGPGDDPA